MEHPAQKTRKLLSLGKNERSNNKEKPNDYIDGGGVRGMSTIAILRHLMDRLAYERKVEEIHPWQEFDMIGGTSTVSIVVLIAYLD
jgi:patatin-like phospholipase/acyl hydrolase